MKLASFVLPILLTVPVLKTSPTLAYYFQGSYTSYEKNLHIELEEEEDAVILTARNYGEYTIAYHTIEAIFTEGNEILSKTEFEFAEYLFPQLTYTYILEKPNTTATFSYRIEEAMAFSGVKNYIITNNSNDCELTNFSYDKTTKDFQFLMKNNTDEVLVFGGGYLIDSEDTQYEIHMFEDNVQAILPDYTDSLRFETEGNPSLAVDRFTYRLYAIGAIDNRSTASNGTTNSENNTKIGAIVTIACVLSFFLLACGIIGGVFLSQHLAKKKKNK